MMEERFEHFTAMLTNISRSIHKIKTEEMSAFNLKSSHLSCLYYLYKKDTLTAKELCDYCDEDKANISRSVKYLEENGYLSCHSKTQKRYQCPLRLTERGIEVGKRITERINSAMESACFGLSEEEYMAMYHSLSIICENLQRFCERYDEKKAAFNWKESLLRLTRVPQPE